MRLAGEFDMAGVPLLRAALADMQDDIVVDCSGLTFIDCAGLNGLVTAQKACEAEGARFALMAPPPCLMRVLELVGLEGWFAIRDGSEG
ncbi:MAG: STAS domain-containing protein [Acidimicrobiaceae bacterium]|nr:STAS domain-containing protein [Acidimicrobiaceae bacterium]